jgi:hypothetical protein
VARPLDGWRTRTDFADRSGVIAFESADGRHVIYKRGDGGAPLVEASLTGEASRTLVFCVATFWGFNVLRDSVYYVPCAPARPGLIRVLDPRTGQDRPWAVVPDVENAYLWAFAISPDGASLLYEQIS